MKIVITADWQPSPGRLDEFHRQLTAACRLINAESPDLLVHGGDWWERPNICEQHASTGQMYYAIAQPLRDVLSEQIPVLGIVGNHDKSSDASADPLNALEILGVTIVREPQVVTLAELPDLSICCLPWQWSPTEPAHVVGQRLVDRANEPDIAHRKKLFLAHVQCQRALVSAKRAYDGHGRWCVTPEWLQQLAVDRVVLGDFHRRQPDLAGPGRGGYVGALWQRNFSNEGDPQGFEVWDTETNEVDWVEVSVARRHRTVVLDSLTADNMPEFGPDEIGRVVYAEGVEPPPGEISRLEADGVAVVCEVIQPERATRADAVPAGILQQPIELLRLWAAQQLPPIPDDELTALVDLYSEVTGDGDSLPPPAATAPEPEKPKRPRKSSRTAAEIAAEEVFS